MTVFFIIYYIFWMQTEDSATNNIYYRKIERARLGRFHALEPPQIIIQVGMTICKILLL